MVQQLYFGERRLSVEEVRSLMAARIWCHKQVANGRGSSSGSGLEHGKLKQRTASQFKIYWTCQVVLHLAASDELYVLNKAQKYIFFLLFCYWAMGAWDNSGWRASLPSVSTCRWIMAWPGYESSGGSGGGGSGGGNGRQTTCTTFLLLLLFPWSTLTRSHWLK